jgi:ABC-2 type transport system permease protein
VTRGDQAFLGGRRVNAVRVAWLFLKVGVLNELQYRVNFVVQLFQSLIQVGTGLAVLALVYSHTDELNGWSESELLTVLGIQILLGGIIRAGIQPNMQRLMEDVQEGTLDYALTKPEDAQSSSASGWQGSSARSAYWTRSRSAARSLSAR